MRKLLAILTLLATSSMAAYQPAGPKNAFVTTNELGANATFDSGYLDAQGFSQVQTHILASHDGILTFRFATDSAGADVVRTLSIPYVAASGYQLYSAPVFADYIQYSFSNTTASVQTNLYYETKFLTEALSPQVLRLDGTLAGGMMAAVGRNVLVGITEGGYYDNVQVDGSGNLGVNIKSPKSSFGEISTITPTPVAQVDFVYGVNTDLIEDNSSGSGSIGSTNQQIEVSSGAAATSVGSAYSKRYLKYRPGQGALGRYTARFDTPKNGNLQVAGLFDPSFNNGFGFGWDTNSNFGFLRLDDGVFNWTAQANWNKDVCDGSGGSSNPSGMNLSHTNGNVYQIGYQFLGYGAIYASIEEPTTGQLIPVHVVPYAGTSADTSISQSSLNLMWRSDNQTNDTDVVVRGASGALFLEGERRFLGPQHGTSINIPAFPDATNQIAIALRNATSYNTVANRSQIRLKRISMGASDNSATPDGNIALNIYRDATLSGVPTFVAVNGQTSDDGVTITNGNSIASYFSSSSLSTNNDFTGGSLIYSGVITLPGSLSEFIQPDDIYISPSETLLITVQPFTGGEAPDISVGVTWSEDL